jgi:hypothetical protein
MPARVPPTDFPDMSKHTKHMVTIQVTENELAALDAVITTADQANYEWAKNGGGDDAEAEARNIAHTDRLLKRIRKAMEGQA